LAIPGVGCRYKVGTAESFSIMRENSIKMKLSLLRSKRKKTNSGNCGKIADKYIYISGDDTCQDKGKCIMCNSSKSFSKEVKL
jgi:hypothetical protein